MIEKRTERKIKCLKTDNGLEFCNYVLDDFYNMKILVRLRNCVGSPQQNSTAERMDRMFCDKARSMLSHSDLEQEF